MDNKKKVIIAIIIFIFLGLMVFTFANPNESENKAQGEGNGTTEKGSKTDEKDDSNEKVNNETNNNENDNNTNVNDHGVTVNNLLTTNNDDSYNNALNAVINAEKLVDEDSYNTAVDLVDKVTNGESKEELNNRLEEVKNGIDAKTLVATLESKTNSASNKADMEGARDYRTEEDIVNLVSGLSNKELKTELQSTLETLALLLDDTTNPKVNIEDGAILAETTKIEIEDENEVTITLTKGEDSKEITNGAEVSDGDGIYTLMVVDEAFNEEIITFTIDTTDPSFNVISGSHSKESINVVVDDLTLDYIEIYNQDKKTKEIVTDSEFTLTDEATYRLTAYDKTGRSTEVWLAVDQTNPEIAGAVNGGIYKKTTVTVTDKFLTEVLVNSEKQDDIVTTGTKNEGKELVLEFTEEGNYTVVAKDKVGNETTVTFTIDKTKPVITGVEDGAYYKTEVTPVVTDDNFKNATLKYNGVHDKSYKVGDTLTKEGTYTLVATDLAMNKTKLITFTIDKTYPVFVGYPESGFTEEDFIINVDDLTDVTITLSKRNASKDEGYPKTVENGYVITEEGSYILEATDKAGNTTRVNLGVDKNAPEVTGVEDGAYYNISVTPVVTDLQLAGAIRLNGEKYTSGTEITEEGTYTLVATDRVGHTTTVTFTIDKSAPSITKVPDGKIVNYSVSPKIEDINLDTVILVKNGEKVKNYQDNMYELSHEGTYEITACDKAKNCTTVSFEIDRTAPVMTKLQVYNKNNTSSEYVKNGDTVRVLVTFDEKLETLPTLTMGNTTATFNETSDGKGGVIYSADLTIPEDESELAEGILAYTVSGYKDIAGNEGNILNETLAQMTLTYDRTNPGYNYVGIMNIDQVTEGYAKVGDRVWVYVVVNEHLSKEPTITINGVKADIIQTEDGANFNANWYKYVGQVVMTEEMTEGEIEFTIDGYKDLAGNEGSALTNANINKGLEKIVLDKTAPTLPTKEDTVGTDPYYSRVSFKPQDNMAIDYYVINGTKVDLTNNWISDINYQNIKSKLVAGENTIVLYDAAGNKIEKKFYMDWTAPKFKPDQWSITLEADKDTNFECPDMTAYVTDSLSGVKSVKLDEWYAQNWSIPDQTKPGSFVCRYYSTDNAGNSVANDIFYTVVDTTRPVVIANLDENGNRDIVIEAGTEYKELGAVVTDNVDADRTMEPNEVKYYSLDMVYDKAYTEELNNSGTFVNTNKIGRYLLIYETKDTAGNISDRSALISKRWVTVQDTKKPIVFGINKGRTYEKVNVTVKDATKVTATMDGEEYILGTDYAVEGTHMLVVTDEAGNYTRVPFTIDSTPANVENGVANLTEDIVLVDQPFYNLSDNTEVITINGNGKTVTQYVTSLEQFDKWEGYIPKMGNVFSSTNGSKLTVNDLTFTGTIQSIGLGHYVSGNATQQSNFETEFNNVNIIGLEVISLSAGISPATVVYGTATLNNTNIYGTQLSKYDTYPMWPVYDLALTNYSTTTINGGKIGSIITWNQMSLTLNNVEVDTILTSAYKRDGIIVNSGSKVNLIDVNETGDTWRAPALAAKITINSGALVNTLDLKGINENAQIIIEDGATVNTIITDNGEMTLAEWKAANA